MARAAPGIQRERIALRLEDGVEVDVERVRDPRARRLRLLVGERGVRLTVPRGASLREAQVFLEQHRGWLGQQLRRAAARELPAALQPGVTDCIPLRGGSLPLRWTAGRYCRLEHDADGLQLALPPAASVASAKRLLRDFYTAQARADVGRWLSHYLPTLPRPPSAIRLRPLSSLWGSLSPDSALSLDLSLVLGPPDAFEYVLVHELCHLLQRNHGPAFWREVERRWPQWRAQRVYLRGEGMALKASLKALVGT